MKTKKGSWQYCNAPANGLLVIVGILYAGTRCFWEVLADKCVSNLPLLRLLIWYIDMNYVLAQFIIYLFKVSDDIFAVNFKCYYI